MREWAVWAGDDLVLGLATVFEPDAVLGPVLLSEVNGRRVWELVWERCLAGRRQVITGCGGNRSRAIGTRWMGPWGVSPNSCAPLAEEIGETWSGFTRKAEEAVKKLAEKWGWWRVALTVSWIRGVARRAGMYLVRVPEDYEGLFRAMGAQDTGKGRRVPVRVSAPGGGGSLGEA